MTVRELVITHPVPEKYASKERDHGRLLILTFLPYIHRSRLTAAIAAARNNRCAYIISPGADKRFLQKRGRFEFSARDRRWKVEHSKRPRSWRNLSAQVWYLFFHMLPRPFPNRLSVTYLLSGEISQSAGGWRKKRAAIQRNAPCVSSIMRPAPCWAPGFSTAGSGGGGVWTPPLISAPGRRRENPKAAFENSRKIISKSFRSFFGSGQNWSHQGSKLFSKTVVRR